MVSGLVYSYKRDNFRDVRLTSDCSSPSPLSSPSGPIALERVLGTPGDRGGFGGEISPPGEEPRRARFLKTGGL